MPEADASPADLLSPEILRKYRVRPRALEQPGLRLATARPLDLEAAADLEFLAGRPILEELNPDLALDSDHSASSESSPPKAENATDAAPVVALVRSILEEAIRRRASDVHFEPLAGHFRVRFRVDGVLGEAFAPPLRLQAAVLSRLKLLAGLSLAEKRAPQDGRLRMNLGGRELDLRASSLPTVHGESVVLRVLDPRDLGGSLTELGLEPDDARLLARFIGRPDGLVLVTGPTGSGKTTTLYSCLQQLNRTGTKLITVEDPVEFELTGVNQVQVRPGIGLTFAATLRAMLRQAPDIILVGEIRDPETASIALNAALTGHLVLATLHTADSVGAVVRLLEMGVPPYLIATSLRGVVAQRLVRRLCERCKQPVNLAPRESAAIGLDADSDGPTTVWRSTGCPNCAGAGFRGRLGIFEVLEVDDGFRERILARAGRAALRAHARSRGLRTLRDDGWRKVTAGLTTAAEVVSIVGGKYS